MAQLRESELMKSVDELNGLASKIIEFNTRLQDLQKHVEFVGKAIDAKINNGNAAESLVELTPSIVPETIPHRNQTPQLVTVTVEKDSQKSSHRRSELSYLCETMCSRGLKKYVISHLSEIQSVRREEAISALKSAPKPAKLVLECVGRFFLQGTRAYTKNSPMITSRQASVLVLELFLGVIGDSGRAGEIEIEKPVKEEAENNAIAWKKRLISEGGVCKACEIDTRGLLLFIACFGIPKGFKNDDIRDLIRFSNLKELGHLLKGSCVLVPKIPEIIENMKKNGMHVEAVDAVYTFGIEDKFSPHKILVSFLRECKDAWTRTKRDAPVSLKKEANKKHLAALQSVIKCLEDKKIDPAKMLPGWQIKDKIIKLENDIADLDKQIMDNKRMPKRKAGEIDSHKWNSQEMKYRRFTASGSTLDASTLMTSPHVFQLPDPRVPNYADEKSSYDGLRPKLFDGGFRSSINGHPAVSAASHVYNPGPLPDVLGSLVGGGSRMNAVGIESNMSPGIATRTTGSFNGVHGETSVDKYDQMMYANGSSYGWHTAGDAAYNDRENGQSFTGQPPATVFHSLYRPSPSLERFVGLRDPSSVDGGNPNSSSDLYSFADAVI